MQKNIGFTLVELSIVLVIIGLLIGGILVGQSLIESAKVNSSIRQLQQYEIATRTFTSKYKKLPGDSPVFSTPGDGNGSVTDLYTWGGDSSLYDTEFFAGEIANFWKHLSDSAMIKATYTSSGGAAQNIGIGTNSPKFPLGTNATVIFLVSTAGSVHASTQAHVFSIRTGNLAGGGGTTTFTAGAEPNNSTPLTAYEAFMLDSKMDDGIANLGNLRASNGERAGLNPTLRNSDCVAADVSKYKIEPLVAGTNCAISVRYDK